MKSFTTFIREYYSSVPVVDIETTGTDVSIPEIKDELNRNLDLTLRQQFKTLDEAIAKVRKLLAMYNLEFPYVKTTNDKSGSLEVIVGDHYVVWDEFKGKIEDYRKYTVKFSFKLIDGLYKCQAELI